MENGEEGRGAMNYSRCRPALPQLLSVLLTLKSENCTVSRRRPERVYTVHLTNVQNTSEEYHDTIWQAL